MFISWLFARPNGLSIKNGSLRTIPWVISTILPFQSWRLGLGSHWQWVLSKKAIWKLTGQLIRSPKLHCFLAPCQETVTFTFWDISTNNCNAPDQTDPNRDKLWKIRPFLDALVPRFTAVYAPSQNLSLDETLIKFKGRVHFRQFLPLKRSRFGIKGFVIADSASGYVLDTSIYTGKEGPAASKDLAQRIVLKLTEPYFC